jgi:hypothetical protein
MSETRENRREVARATGSTPVEATGLPSGRSATGGFAGTLREYAEIARRRFERVEMQVLDYEAHRVWSTAWHGARSGARS